MNSQIEVSSDVRTRFNKPFSALIDEICLSYDGWIDKAPKEKFLRAAEAVKVEHEFNKFMDLVHKNSVDQAANCNKLYELRSKIRSLPEGQIESLVDEFIAELPTGGLQTEFQEYRDYICVLLKSDLALDKKD